MQNGIDPVQMYGTEQDFPASLKKHPWNVCTQNFRGVGIRALDYCNAGALLERRKAIPPADKSVGLLA